MPEIFIIGSFIIFLFIWLGIRSFVDHDSYTRYSGYIYFNTSIIVILCLLSLWGDRHGYLMGRMPLIYSYIVIVTTALEKGKHYKDDVLNPIVYLVLCWALLLQFFVFWNLNIAHIYSEGSYSKTLAAFLNATAAFVGIILFLRIFIKRNHGKEYQE